MAEMKTINPYQPPSGAAKIGMFKARAPRPAAPRIISSLLLLLFALGVLLLLNGQFFTNAIIAAAFISLSALPWLSLCYEDDWSKLARLVLIAHLILVAALLFTLPKKYAEQKAFNSRLQKIRTSES